MRWHGAGPIVLNVGITIVAIIGLAAGIAGFAGRMIPMELRVPLVDHGTHNLLSCDSKAAAMWIQIGALVGISVQSLPCTGRGIANPSLDGRS